MTSSLILSPNQIFSSNVWTRGLMILILLFWVSLLHSLRPGIQWEFLFDAYTIDYESNYFVKTCLPTSVMFSFLPVEQAAKIMAKINRSITWPLFWSMCIQSRFDSDWERVIFLQSLLDIGWGRHHLVSIPTLLIFVVGLRLFARLKFKIQVLLSAKWVLTWVYVRWFITIHWIWVRIK